MSDGWVKLWRKSLESRVFQNKNLWQVWCYCLMRANHKGKWVSVATGRGETEVWVDSGQFIFGRKKAAQKMRMKPSSVRNQMLKLQNMQNLDIQSGQHYSVVTIINWESYQTETNNVDSTKGQPCNNQRTTKGQPKDTNKNDKNEKNIKHSPANADPEKQKTDNATKFLYESKVFPKVHAFTNKMRKANRNEKAIHHALERVWRKSQENILNFDPWAYAMKVISVEDGNYNERDFMDRQAELQKQAEELRKQHEGIS